jgi:hypothetical protein
MVPEIRTMNPAMKTRLAHERYLAAGGPCGGGWQVYFGMPTPTGDIGLTLWAKRVVRWANFFQSILPPKRILAATVLLAAFYLLVTRLP